MNIQAHLLVTALLVSPMAFAENVVKVPRERGAVHSEFKTLLRDQIKAFKNGVGRIALTGKSGGDQCRVNFYTNESTTFVTVNVDDGHFYNEFYIDHPTQSFRKILFQNLITREDGVELKVVKRHGGYSIITDGQHLTVSTKSNTGKASTCTFNLAQAHFFEGETE
ncbi:MAG: hypothetical protein CSA49_06220 [Gammaproteobacteria bacterium]|nr:MAG: hypothetical protein CSA49_06220 [Gammaproteobacteria bacterium]